MVDVPENYEEIVMKLIVDGGNARSLAMEAIQRAKHGEFAEAESLLEECDKALLSAHHTQTAMIQDELAGNHIPIMLLMVHAQDHFMDAMVVKDLAAEIVELYRTHSSITDVK